MQHGVLAGAGVAVVPQVLAGPAVKMLGRLAQATTTPTRGLRTPAGIRLTIGLARWPAT